MSRHAAVFFSVLLAVAALAQGEQAKPKNVIIMIGDGMGYGHIEAASLYRYGKPDGQVYRSFSHYAMATHSMENKRGYDLEKAWKEFKCFHWMPTCSAAAGTALSTGHKTHSGAVGVTKDGEPLPHLLDDAEALGKSTGVLSTVRINHATPASFVAHVSKRSNDLEIAQQMILERPIDVLMGPGHPWFDANGKQTGGFEPDLWETGGSYQHVAGLETWQKLRAGEAGSDANGDGTPDPWTLVDTLEGFEALARSENLPDRVLGLAPVSGTLQQDRRGDDQADAFQVPFTPGLPDMALLMRAAIAVLSQNPEGFFLMAEGGAIDWASHGNQGGRVIEEQIDFDKAIDAAVAWVEEHSNWEETALFITADHETGYLWGPGSDPEWQPLQNNGAGVMPGMAFYSKSHTSQLVPLYAKGPGTEGLAGQIQGQDPRRGPFVDNTSIAAVVREAWGLTSSR
jgi:alkaline phosphatase